MLKLARPWLMIFLVCALSTLLTACALRSLFGNVIIVEDIENEVNEIITTVFSESTAAVCLNTDYGFYECTYIIDGDIITSTLYLLSEYGLTGVLIDPVILQVPSDAAVITSTYDIGGGPQPLHTNSTIRFYVSPTISVTSETGHRFLILELPPSVTGTLPSGDPDNAPEIDYSIGLKQQQPLSSPIDPVQIKVMLTGKVTVNEHDYYVPTLPCTTDFAGIPALEIPQSDTPVNLQPAVGNLIRQAGNVVCDHQAYYFNNVPPPPLRIYLPIAIR